MGSQEFCLKWNNHQGNLIDVFDDLLKSEEFVDVTLACQGLSIKVHKVVLSACSSFFKDLFHGNPCKHPIVFMNDVNFSDLQAIVQFMYKGEVNISQEQLPNLLKTAEALKVKGLAEVSADKNSSDDIQKIPSPKRKRQNSGSSHPKSQVNNLKSKKDERKNTKFDRTMMPHDFLPTNQINDNGFPPTPQNQNMPFDDNNANTSNQLPSIPNDINVPVKNIKSSPHSSPEHSIDQDMSSCVDPNQFLLQQFSCSESNIAKTEESSPSCSVNISSQSVFPSSSQPPFEGMNLTSMPSSTFSSNTSFTEQQQLYTSSSSGQPKISQNQSPFPSTMSMNAMGVSMTEIPYNQDSAVPANFSASEKLKDMDKALETMLKNGLSCRRTAAMFNVCHVSLWRRLKAYRRTQAASGKSSSNSSDVNPEFKKFSLFKGYH